MDTEGNVYDCARCGAEVQILKKPVQDPKCPTLLCCGMPMTAKDAAAVTTEKDVEEVKEVKEVKEVVKGRYDACAERGGGEGAVCCAGETPANPSFAAEHGLYSQEELSLVPETAFTLSRGCGNPTGFANLHPGEVVADFGCGAGIDVVLAAKKVSPAGKVVGVDFAPHMLERAQQTVKDAHVAESTTFVLSDLAKVELPDDYADVIISNCVINLSPCKVAVYREAFRLLKPGGRLAISDIVYSGKIDPQVRDRFQSTWAGCVGGAIEEDTYFEILHDTGFADIEVVARHPLESKELEEMACCPGPEFTPAPTTEDLASVEGKVVSIKFRASKPSVQ